MITRDQDEGGLAEPHVIHPAPLRGGQAQDTHVGSGDNVVDLLKQLVGQGSHLAEQQLALIKAADVVKAAKAVLYR